LSHDGDDFFYGRRVGGIPQTLFRGGRPQWKPGMVAGERGRPAASRTTGSIMTEASLGAALAGTALAYGVSSKQQRRTRCGSPRPGAVLTA
jgi:hypothetical protein